MRAQGHLPPRRRSVFMLCVVVVVARCGRQRRSPTRRTNGRGAPKEERLRTPLNVRTKGDEKNENLQPWTCNYERAKRVFNGRTRKKEKVNAVQKLGSQTFFFRFLSSRSDNPHFKTCSSLVSPPSRKTTLQCSAVESN